MIRPGEYLPQRRMKKTKGKRSSKGSGATNKKNHEWRTNSHQSQHDDVQRRDTYFRGRNRTVTATFSFASNGTLSENEHGVLLRAEEDAGELIPSTEVSRNSFEDDVVEDDGEFAALEPLNPNPFDFALRFDAIAKPSKPQTLKTKTKIKNKT